VGDTDHPQDSDLVEVDDNGKFLKLHLKPHKTIPQKYKSMRGVYILNRKTLRHIPQNQYYEIDHNLLPDVLENGGNFYGYETKDYLLDIGTPERYKSANERLMDKKIR